MVVQNGLSKSLPIALPNLMRANFLIKPLICFMWAFRVVLKRMIAICRVYLFPAARIYKADLRSLPSVIVSLCIASSLFQTHLVFGMTGLYVDKFTIVTVALSFLLVILLSKKLVAMDTLFYLLVFFLLAFLLVLLILLLLFSYWERPVYSSPHQLD